MRLATTLENETLDQLVARVYELPADRKGGAVRAARKALTDANPYLSAIGSVPPGTVILVPDVKGASVLADATSEPGPLIGEVAVAQLRGAVTLAAQQLADEVGAELEDARATAKLAQSAEVRRAAKEQAAELKAVVQAGQQRVQHAQQLQRQQKQVFGQIEKDLAEMVGRFG